MTTIFKEGQTVWCLHYGEGEVQSIGRNAHPIYVKFKNGESESYTTDGAVTIKAKRSLFFSEPKVEAKTEPDFIPTLEGKTLLVRYKKDSNKMVQIAVVQTEDKAQISVCLINNSQTVFYMNKEDYNFIELSQVKLTAFT